MLRNKIAAFIMTVVLGLSISLVGCGSKGGGALDVSGYQGKLDGGYSFVYLKAQDETVIISLTDDEHQGDDALTYTGEAVKDDAGKTTVTDEESGQSVTFTITENADGTANVEVDGYGKGALTSYEGNLFSVLGSMAEDDA